MTGFGPVPSAFLNEPEAGDVFQEADGAFDAAFVGEVILESGGIDPRLGEFDAHERPGAGAEVYPVIAPAGDGCDGGAGVMGCGGDDEGIGEVIAGEFLLQVLREGAEDGAGLNDFGEDTAWDAEAVEDVIGPVAGARIEHLAGGGEGVLGGDSACEPVVQEIGDPEDLIGCLELGRLVFDHGIELKEGIEREELKAGALEEGFFAELIEDRLHSGGVTFVSVVEWDSDQAAAAADQADIDAPCVDAEGADLAVVADGVAQAGLEFFPEKAGIPVQAAEALDGTVDEAMDLLEFDALVVEGTDEGAAAACAEVKSQ